MSMRPTGHIRERSPGSWELRYSLGTDPATGKRRIATATVRGKRRDAEKELRRTLDTGEHVDPTRMTVRQWLTTWLATVREEISPKSQERYAEVVHNFLIPAIGNIALSRIGPNNLQEAYNRWSTGGRRDGKAGGLSPLTRRYIHSVVRSALGRAVEQQLLSRNPADAFKKRLPRAERREMTTLNAEQSAQLFAATKHTPIYWPVLLALSTGMRRGEILALDGRMWISTAVHCA
jgi:integrase